MASILQTLNEKMLDAKRFAFSYDALAVQGNRFLFTSVTSS